MYIRINANLGTNHTWANTCQTLPIKRNGQPIDQTDNNRYCRAALFFAQPSRIIRISVKHNNRDRVHRYYILDPNGEVIKEQDVSGNPGGVGTLTYYLSAGK